MNAKDGIKPEEAEVLLRRQADNLAHLGNIRLQVTLELGRKQMPLREVLQLKLQDVIELPKQAGEAFETRVNGHVFAESEIVVVTDVMACRVVQINHPKPPTTLQIPEQAVLPADVSEAPEEPADDEQTELHKRRMILIPAGPFTMGGRDEDSPARERPAHTVYLSNYYIDPFPVTNADYREFVKTTGHPVPNHWSRDTFSTGMGNHPVTNVSWQDARAYCEWSGVRLATEPEWEKAARGEDERPYPWGGRFVEGERCNSTNYYGTTTPVDEFPDGRSPYGIWDMAGNVYEWCADYYDETYYQHSPTIDPQGPNAGSERAVRGGDYQETRAGVRTTHRTGQAETYNRDNIGFRVAMDA